jgi:hypothetical protein
MSHDIVLDLDTPLLHHEANASLLFKRTEATNIDTLCNKS